MLTLLVVDDDPFVLKMLERTLESAGFHVLTAAHGQAALQVLRSGQAPIDLLISDINMPTMDGHALAKEIASSYPEIPILFISGNYSSCPLRRGEPYSFLGKPFTHGALLGAVQCLLTQDSPESSGKRSRTDSAA